MKRKLFIAASLASIGLAGCGRVKESLTNGPFRGALLSTEKLNDKSDRHARHGASLHRRRHRP